MRRMKQKEVTSKSRKFEIFFIKNQVRVYRFKELIEKWSFFLIKKYCNSCHSKNCSEFYLQKFMITFALLPC